MVFSHTLVNEPKLERKCLWKYLHNLLHVLEAAEKIHYKAKLKLRKTIIIVPPNNVELTNW